MNVSFPKTGGLPFCYLHPDFFLWDHLIACVYGNNLHFIGDLKANIESEIQQTSVKILWRVPQMWQNIFMHVFEEMGHILNISCVKGEFVFQICLSE